jgi:hypothetical protein
LADAAAAIALADAAAAMPHHRGAPVLVRLEGRRLQDLRLLVLDLLGLVGLRGPVLDFRAAREAALLRQRCEEDRQGKDEMRGKGTVVRGRGGSSFGCS